MLRYTSSGRILDEEQLFQPGDQLTYKGKSVIIERVAQQSVYYEHRPIASYKAFFYIVKTEIGEKLYLSTEDLTG